jgi:hypothetical protein
MNMDAPVTEQPIPQDLNDGSSTSPIQTRYLILGGVVALILLVLFVVFVLWAADNFAPELEAMRDIFIIALAVESCLFGVILVIMLMMLVRLVNMLEYEIKPILEKTNETVGMVRGTTTFVGQNVVRPVTKASAYLAGVRRGLRVLFGDPSRNLPD